MDFILPSLVRCCLLCHRFPHCLVLEPFKADNYSGPSGRINFHILFPECLPKKPNIHSVIKFPRKSRFLYLNFPHICLGTVNS